MHLNMLCCSDMAQLPTLVMDNYKLRGDFVDIECKTSLAENTYAAIIIQYGTREYFKDLVISPKNQSQPRTVAFFKDRIYVLSHDERKVKIKFTKLSCGDSWYFRCAVLGTNFITTVGMTEKLNVVDNANEPTLNTRSLPHSCNGTSADCRECQGFGKIGVYAEIGKSFTIECKKDMPFTHSSENVNTFRWYMNKTNVGGKSNTSEVTTGVTGRSPNYTESQVSSVSTAEFFQNCQRQQTKTSTLTYTPAKYDKLITITCTVDLQIEGHVDRKTTEDVTICVLEKSKIVGKDADTDVFSVAGSIIIGLSTACLLIAVCALVICIMLMKQRKHTQTVKLGENTEELDNIKTNNQMHRYENQNVSADVENLSVSENCHEISTVATHKDEYDTIEEIDLKFTTATKACSPLDTTTNTQNQGMDKVLACEENANADKSNMPNHNNELFQKTNVISSELEIFAKPEFTNHRMDDTYKYESLVKEEPMLFDVKQAYDCISRNVEQTYQQSSVNIRKEEKLSDIRNDEMLDYHHTKESVDPVTDWKYYTKNLKKPHENNNQTNSYINMDPYVAMHTENGRVLGNGEYYNTTSTNEPIHNDMYIHPV